MKRPRQIVRELMDKKGLTREDMARAVGISVRSFNNLLSGAPNKIASQRITDLFGRTIFPGVAPSGRQIRVTAGTEFEFDTPQQAVEFASAVGSSVTIAGSSVRFVLPTRFSISIQIPIQAKPKNLRAE